ncbi:MAG: SDR family NAD(P)-dependent oxidoreductase [Promethearchaeota archaeon]
MLLNGKNIIITGSGRGIGRSVAIACAKEGANLGLIARTLEELTAVKKEINLLNLGIKVEVRTADVTNYGELDDAMKHFNDKLGGFNGIIANAGTSWKSTTHECEPEQFAKVLNVNVLGVFNTFKASYPYLIKDDKKNRARFMITGSAAYHHPMPKFAAYTASKFAVVGLMHSLALEYSREYINFNTILPTMVDTRLLRGKKAGDGNKPPNVLDPEDLNDYYLFIMSDVANKVSNQLIATDDFQQIKKIIAEAPDDKKESWAVFKEYLAEQAPALYKGLRKLRKLAEFILDRSR